MSKIAIYGAGGFGKEVRMLLSIIDAKNNQFSFGGFIDDFAPKEPTAVENTFEDVLIAIADCSIREKIYKKVQSKGYPFSSLIHPNIYVDKSNLIGIGAIICAGVYMTVNITIGKCVIINLGATIGHDVVIGDFTSIMPSVNISGSVKIGNNVFIGSGATILQGLTIEDNVTIGAGAVVTRSVSSGRTVVGVPAQDIIRK